MQPSDNADNTRPDTNNVHLSDEHKILGTPDLDATTTNAPNATYSRPYGKRTEEEAAADRKILADLQRVHWGQLAILGLTAPIMGIISYGVVLAAHLSPAWAMALVFVLPVLPLIIVFGILKYTVSKLDDLLIPEPWLLTGCSACFAVGVAPWIFLLGLHAPKELPFLAIAMGVLSIPVAFMLGLLLFTFFLVNPRFFIIPEILRCTIIMLLAGFAFASIMLLPQ